jgi:hypothetical protein
MGKRRGAYSFLAGKSKESRPFGNLDVDGKIALKQIFQK